MKQSTTESFRIEKDILDSIRKITDKTGQTSKAYIELILRKKVEKDLRKHFKEKNLLDIIDVSDEKNILNSVEY